MSILDPRQFLLPNFCMDPATQSLFLSSFPMTSGTKKSDGGGKMTSSVTSFRISSLLEEKKESDEDAHDCSTDSERQLRSSSEECTVSIDHGSFNDASLRGSPSEDSPNGLKKARKARTIFTDKQLQELESTFEKQKYLSVQDRMDLANRMGLSDTQVKTWYQNRRTKWKRQSSVGMDLLSDANNLAAVQQLLRTNPYWASGYLTNMPPFMMNSSYVSSMPLPFMLPPPKSPQSTTNSSTD